MQTLLQIFQKTKEVLCKYDYYIQTSKRMLHLTNTEIKVPHLMEMQADRISLLENLVFMQLKTAAYDGFCGETGAKIL